MADWDRIAKLAGRLGSDHEPESLAAVRLIAAQLQADGLTWADFANRLRGVAAARTSAERSQDSRRAWDARMAEEEEKMRQAKARARRKREMGREW